MPVPKSVLRINKDGVHYKSSVDKCNYYIFELTRASLRDASKFIVRGFRDSFYSHFNKITGNAGKATKYKIYSSAKTKYPRAEIGLRTDKGDGFYAYFQEVGSVKQPKLALLNKFVSSNIPKILEIESQYLSAINVSDSAVQAKIHEGEMEGDGDG